MQRGCGTAIQPMQIAALYTSGYVECLRWVRGGCRKRYDFVPYMDLPDGWFTKGGNSYCSEHWPMVRR